jgi:hypothetical protein
VLASILALVPVGVGVAWWLSGCGPTAHRICIYERPCSVAIQLSGTFGSRQEEAQRLGRLLRPKGDGGPANLYTVVTRDTVDQRYANNGQRFLTEQGHSYTILDADQR